MNSAGWDVSEQVAQRAFATIKLHPLQTEALGHPYCFGEVFEESKKLIDHMGLSDDEKSCIQADLADVEAVLMVVYWTSERKPEPLSGGGKHYTFILHPRSFALLHSSVGTWRS
jgi:hypothetical protein